jgi:feruloyl esterase
MWHCAGGPGPNAFGYLTSSHLAAPSPPVNDATHGTLIALQQWVERGVAPERLVATCRTCRKPAVNPAPAPEYLN